MNPLKPVDRARSWLTSFFAKPGRGVLRVVAERILAVGHWPSLPAAHADFRSGLASIYGGAGVADSLHWERKNDAGVHQWVSLVSPGPGTGTVDVFNVMDYGAKGDGTTDDDAALTAAVAAADAAGGGVVYLPPGTYFVAGEWSIQNVAKIHIVGAGMGITTIKGDGGVSDELVNVGTCSYITVRDLTLDGNATGNTPLQFVSCDHVTVHRVEVKNHAVNGILFDTAGDHCEVAHCVVEGGERGIRGSGPIDHFRIVSNQVRNVSEAGINVGGSLHVVIANNVIWNDGADPPNNGYAGIRLTNGGAHISVTGNTIRRFGRGIGYYAIPVELGDPRGEESDVSIVGNTIYDCYNTGILIERSGVACVGNIIREGRAEAGILLTNADQCTVVGNSIVDAEDTTFRTYGIQEGGGCNNNFIGFNQINGYLTAAVLITGANTTVFQDHIQFPCRDTGLTSVFNEGGVDHDFRWEGDTATNLLKLDGGLDAVFIGTTTIGAIAEFRTGTTVFNEPGNDLDFRWEGDAATNLLKTDAGVDSVFIGTTAIGAIAKFQPTTIIFNEDAADIDFRVEGDTDAQLLRTDASTDRVGIGVAAPNNKLEVVGTAQVDGLRIDQTPTAETPTPTHTFTISLNGTTYRIPCLV